MFSHTHTHIVDQNDFGLSCIFCLNFVTTCRIDQFHFFPCPCIMCVMVFIVDYDNNPWWILFLFVLPHWHIAFLFVFDFVLDYYIHSSVWIVVKSFYSYSCNDPIETQKTPRLVVVTHSRLLFFYFEIVFFCCRSRTINAFGCLKKLQKKTRNKIREYKDEKRY